jgi:flagellar hook-associated protein 3 FlgL
MAKRLEFRPFAWQGTGNRQLQIVFSSVAGVRSYQLFDASTPDSSGTDLPRQPVGAVLPFTPGQAIPLLTTSADFGAQVVITGSPADGDSFAITPSANKSVFQTIQEMIELLRSPVTSSTARTAFSGELQAHLGNLDQALVNVGRVQATVGARMQELDGLTNNATAVDIQYQQTLSDLQDLDYAAGDRRFHPPAGES